jgi:hypothetical protein
VEWRSRLVRRMGRANGSRERAPDDRLRETHRGISVEIGGYRFAPPPYRPPHSPDAAQRVAPATWCAADPGSTVRGDSPGSARRRFALHRIRNTHYPHVATRCREPRTDELDHQRHDWISPIGTLCNARCYSGMALANSVTLAHVGRQLKLKNRAFVGPRRHPNTAVMAFDN